MARTKMGLYQYATRLLARDRRATVIHDRRDRERRQAAAPVVYERRRSDRRRHPDRDDRLRLRGWVAVHLPAYLGDDLRPVTRAVAHSQARPAVTPRPASGDADGGQTTPGPESAPPRPSNVVIWLDETRFLAGPGRIVRGRHVALTLNWLRPGVLELGTSYCIEVRDEGGPRRAYRAWLRLVRGDEVVLEIAGGDGKITSGQGERVHPDSVRAHL